MVSDLAWSTAYPGCKGDCLESQPKPNSAIMKYNVIIFTLGSQLYLSHSYYSPGQVYEWTKEKLDDDSTAVNQGRSWSAKCL